eukprot:GHVU01178012.1.p1 GENE.GHVU01178012.1~~GHVU01178012.1.p1  ORF type:complete len:259 (+),score=23.93 GHVU01178012.1:2083-2859(+)
MRSLSRPVMNRLHLQGQAGLPAANDEQPHLGPEGLSDSTGGVPPKLTPEQAPENENPENENDSNNDSDSNDSYVSSGDDYPESNDQTTGANGRNNNGLTPGNDGLTAGARGKLHDISSPPSSSLADITTSTLGRRDKGGCPIEQRRVASVFFETGKGGFEESGFGGRQANRDSLRETRFQMRRGSHDDIVEHRAHPSSDCRVAPLLSGSCLPSNRRTRVVPVLLLPSPPLPSGSNLAVKRARSWGIITVTVAACSHSQ